MVKKNSPRVMMLPCMLHFICCDRDFTKKSGRCIVRRCCSVTVCTLFEQVTCERLRPGKMELGLGIQPVDVVVSHFLIKYSHWKPAIALHEAIDRVMLMINGLDPPL